MRNRKYAESTIKQHEKNILLFLEWCRKWNKSVRQCGYPEMIQFIDSILCSESEYRNGGRNINRILSSVTYYYDSLSEKHPSLRNPAKHIRIKKPKKRLVHGLLDNEELLGLYRCYDKQSPRHIRNQVIIGLLIFQGLTTAELQKLSVNDLLFEDGFITIKEGSYNSLKKGSQSRSLKLEAIQVVQMVEYLKNVRPRILSGKYLNSSGRRPGRGRRVKSSDQLIVSLKGSLDIKNTLHHLFIDLRKFNPKVKSARQLRQSLIANWLTRFNLRQVQYMAGHRYAGSTEWYKGANLEELKREIDIYHPLKRRLERVEY
jgi:integrase/recombinase XerD